LRRHDILRSQPHDSLFEDVTIPFGKPDLSPLNPYLVLVAAQNKFYPWKDRTPEIELFSDG
jgi:hypothetical protein